MITFEDYMEAAKEQKDLSTGARCMLYNLIIIWNRWKKGKNWDGWFHATDHGNADNRYVIGGRWGSATYTRYRKELIEKGCIAYERGFHLADGKGIASRYKLLIEPVLESKEDEDSIDIFDFI
ncbi:hypothetical protein [Mitsuokella multacida]|uniref:hypothetical protein n=1 Tax=Mitsuokella multacida TaxID=52226 RepID=UPI0022E4FF73|nr:hypothetical protein [Mitsuokella multacida]